MVCLPLSANDALLKLIHFSKHGEFIVKLNMNLIINALI